MTSDLQWVETLLKKNEDIMEIISIELSPASEKWESYSCLIKRIIIKILLRTSATCSKSLILKKYLQKNSWDEEIHKRNFQTEIDLYKDTFPQMEKLMSDFNCTDGVLWPKFFGTNENCDSFLMEDLKETSHSCVELRPGFDEKHLLFTIKEVARFHAMSIILLDKGLLIPNKFQTYNMGGNFEFMNNFYCGNYRILEKVIRSTWDQSWLWAADMLNKLQKINGIKLKELYDEEYPLQVLNHGDIWVNNIMFKYRNGSTDPVELKFLDFELAHVNSFAWDLNFLFYISVRLPLRNEKFDHFLQTYRDSLLSYTNKYGGNKIKIPDLDILKKEMNRLLFHALGIAINDVPFMVADKESIIDESDNFEGEKFKSQIEQMYKTSHCRNALQQELTFFKKYISNLL